MFPKSVGFISRLSGLNLREFRLEIPIIWLDRTVQLVLDQQLVKTEMENVTISRGGFFFILSNKLNLKCSKITNMNKVWNVSAG